MSRPRSLFLAPVLALSGVFAAFATASATTVISTDDGLQFAVPVLTHHISSYPTPPVTPTFPVQNFKQLTPGSVPVVWPNGWGDDYRGGSGVAAAAFVDGPAVFSPNLVQPFLADSWAAASARTGQLRANTHGSLFQRERTLPRPTGYNYQYDTVRAQGYANAGIGNEWMIELDQQYLRKRDADGRQSIQPLVFGITLDIDTRFAWNPANANIYFPQPAQPGGAGLHFSISFERLLTLDGSPPPATLPDGSPSVVTYTHSFAFDGSHQGRQTLNFEFEDLPALRFPAPPRTFWVPGVGVVHDYQDGRPHSCLEGYAPGTPFGDYCPVKISTEISLGAGSTFNLAEASVSATWSARINGSTEGVKRVITNADQWGQELDPSLVLRPSIVTPVPEPEVWSMLMLGLGGLTWRLRRRG